MNRKSIARSKLLRQVEFRPHSCRYKNLRIHAATPKPRTEARRKCFIGRSVRSADAFMQGLCRVFVDCDCSMAEINPLVVTGDGELLALDAKMTFDDNALFRHSNISELRDKSQEDVREMRAADRGLSYVSLDGNIGCIINGAGLAMATMDMIMHARGGTCGWYATIPGT